MILLAARVGVNSWPVLQNKGRNPNSTVGWFLSFVPTSACCVFDCFGLSFYELKPGVWVHKTICHRLTEGQTVNRTRFLFHKIYTETADLSLHYFAELFLPHELFHILSSYNNKIHSIVVKRNKKGTFCLTNRNQNICWAWLYANNMPIFIFDKLEFKSLFILVS